jgi:PAS domain S-box-containing protein
MEFYLAQPRLPPSPTTQPTRLLPPVVQVLPCPIAVIGSDGRVHAANPAWERMARPNDSGGQTDMYLGDLFPDAARAASEVLRGAGTVSRRALPLAGGPSGAATWWDLELVPHSEAPDLVLITARDVTEYVLAHRDAEDTRAAIEPIDARLRLAQEAAGIGTWEWQAASDRQSWSPQQFRLYGLDPAVAVPPSFDDWVGMIHPEDRSLIQVALETSLSNLTDDAFQMEFRIRRRDSGAERWMLSLGQVMERSPDGQLLRLLGVNIDVTDRRNEHEALREREALLRLAADAAGVYAWTWDLATDRVTWADGLEGALALPPGGFGGSIEAFRALVHPDDTLSVETELKRAIAGETSRYGATFRMLRADGSIRWTQTRGMVVRDDQGRPVRVVGMDHDITEQKAAEVALRVREAQQAAVARLGQFALATTSAQAVMDEAVHTVAKTLKVEFAKVLELRPGGQELLLRAGRGWSADYPVGRAVVSAGRQSQAGYTLLVGAGPVIVKDLRTEKRFEGPPLLHQHGVVSGMSVIIRGNGAGTQPYGVLGAHSHQHQAFTEHDIRFLEAVANLIASAVQRERAKAALLEGKARLQLFIERAPAAIAMFDTEMRYLAVSQRYIDDYGLAAAAPDDLVGQGFYDIFPNSPQTWRDVHRLVLGGETHRADDESFAPPDGRVESVRWEMTPWRNADGSVAGALLFTEVTTARKAAEAALIESEARFRNLVEAMPQMAFVTLPDGYSEFHNQRWHDYTGILPDEPIGERWADVLHPDDREATLAGWRHSLATGEPYSVEHRVRDAIGQYRWFLTRAAPLRNPQTGEIVRWFGTYTDISGIVAARDAATRFATELEAQIAERTRALTEAAVELQAEMRRRQEVQSVLLQAQKLEALGQLTAGIAHDFNNVLSAIQGSFELIELRTKDEKLLRPVRLGKDAVERATSLTRQLLAFGRCGSLVPVVLDVEQAIRRADEMISHAVGPDVARVRHIQPDVWPVLTDGNQLEVALLNLAINARDAMPEGGRLVLAAGNLPPRERPETLPLKEYVFISVQDTGQGMPPEVVARATEPFYTTKPEGKGTGLGLPMVQAFALRSGGCLRIDSRPNEGTTVQIILPRAVVSGMGRDDAPADEAESAGSNRTGTILVVEDDEQVRQITVNYLQDRGYQVIEAANAEAAAVLTHSTDKLDLLLTDIAMPGTEGLALAKRLRAERPDLPVLFMTGGDDHEDLAGEHVLMKPFTGADLLRAIARRIQGARRGETADGGLLRRLKSPALVAAYLFWRAARNLGKPPRLADLDWGRLPDADHGFTVAVEPGEGSPTFRFLKVGRALIARLGMEGTHVTAEFRPDPNDEMLGSLTGAYRRCVRTSSPSYEYARYDLGDGDPVLFERLILPVSDDGERVTHLVGLALLSGGI